MKAILTLFAVFSLVGATAQAALRPIESLHDLPIKWDGVAGNLLQKVPATLTIDKVRKVSRDDTDTGIMTTLYEVDAQLALGDRKLDVKTVRLTRYNSLSENLDVQLETNDELTMSLFATISYDEASDTYTLQELPEKGQRHFVLKAPARH